MIVRFHADEWGTQEMTFMKAKLSVRKGITFCSAMLLCCFASRPVLADADGLASGMSLYMNGNSLNADIRAKPLSQVARALENKTGIAIQFRAPGMDDLAITVRFEGLAPRAAVKAILKDASYAIVSKPSSDAGDQKTNLRVLVYSVIPDTVSEHRPRDDERDELAEAPDLVSGLTGSGSEGPPDFADLPHAFDLDPAVRVSELEQAVGTPDSESLSLALASAHDADSEVRQTSEELLLNELRDLAPKEALSMMAGTSERTETRVRALEALAGRGKDLRHTRMTLDGALHDSDPVVRQRAKELLLDLEHAESNTD